MSNRVDIRFRDLEGAPFQRNLEEKRGPSKSQEKSHQASHKAYLIGAAVIFVLLAGIGAALVGHAKYTAHGFNKDCFAKASFKMGAASAGAGVVLGIFLGALSFWKSRLAKQEKTACEGMKEDHVEESVLFDGLKQLEREQCVENLRKISDRDFREFVQHFINQEGDPLEAIVSAIADCADRLDPRVLTFNTKESQGVVWAILGQIKQLSLERLGFFKDEMIREETFQDVLRPHLAHLVTLPGFAAHYHAAEESVRTGVAEYLLTSGSSLTDAQIEMLRREEPTISAQALLTHHEDPRTLYNSDLYVRLYLRMEEDQQRVFATSLLEKGAQLIREERRLLANLAPKIDHATFIQYFESHPGSIGRVPLLDALYRGLDDQGKAIALAQVMQKTDLVDTYVQGKREMPPEVVLRAIAQNPHRRKEYMASLKSKESAVYSSFQKEIFNQIYNKMRGTAQKECCKILEKRSSRGRRVDPKRLLRGLPRPGCRPTPPPRNSSLSRRT